MQYLEYINPIIRWVPTLLFILIVASATFTGFCRGFRKSLIFLIHSLIIGGVFIVLFFLFKESDKMDELLLRIINMFIGSDTGLQDMLEVSPHAESLKEVLVLFIPQQLNFVDGLSLILADNGTYLLTLVDLAYSIVFALLFYILYLFFNFIMYIVYLLFYPDRKYKKKMEKRVMKGKSEFGYSKRRLQGSLIGLARGLVSGFIMISLLGSLFFVISGGKGDEKSPQYNLGNEEFNNIYNAYASISEYGTHGIFKVLNAFKDKEEVPYYLFAADIIFSGELKLNEEYSHNVIFREEFATYVDFSKDVLNLMMKYGAEDIRAIINSEEDIDLADAVIKIMVQKEFQTEFEQLIYDFDSKVYLSNFAFSFIDSLITHLDDVEFTKDMDEKTKDLLCILFKNGYLSESIPYEYNLKLSLKANETVDLGHISSSDLINKQNVIAIYKIITEVLYFNNVVEEDPEDILYFEMMNNTVSYISNLTLLNPDDSEKLNNVYRRLYAYVRYNYLDVSEEEEIVNMSVKTSSKEYYIDQEFDSIDWVSELRLLLSVAKDGLYIYQHNDLEIHDFEELIPQLFEIYHSDDEASIELAKRLDKVLNYISSSKLMANVISSKMISGTIEETFSDMFENYIMPEINYSNTYSPEGEIVSHGEAYYFINTIKELLKNEENKVVFDLLFGTVEAENETDMLLQICNVLTSDNNKQTVEYLTGSKLFRSVFTSILEQIETDDGQLIYFDTSILEADMNGAKVITKDELDKVIYLIPSVINLADPFIKGNYEEDDIVNMLEAEEMNDLLDCRLIEGTFSNVLIISLEGNDDLILPKYLINKEKGLVSTDDDISEIKSLININSKLKGNGVSFTTILSGEIEDVLEVFTDAEDIDFLLESDILHYTISNFLMNDEKSNTDLLSFKLVVPGSVRTELNNDSIQYLVDKDTLVDFLCIGKELFPTDEEESSNADGSGNSQNKLLAKVMKNKEKYLSNYILSASLMTYIYEEANNDESSFSKLISLPTMIKDEDNNENLILSDCINNIGTETKRASSYYYDSENVIYKEAFNLCGALDELLGEDFDIFGEEADNSEIIQTSIDEILNNPYTPYKDAIEAGDNSTKFDIIYNSFIVASTLSNKFDDYLDGDLIESNVKDATKENDVFKKDDIKEFIIAMKELNLTNPDENGFGGSINSLADTETNRTVVYESTLALGLITKMIDDVVNDVDDEGYPTNDFRTTRLAYQQDYYDNGVKIYRSCEIDAFIQLLGNKLSEIISNPEEFNIEEFSISDVKEKIFELTKNENEYDKEIISVNSYLIIACVTNKLEQTPGVYIPPSTYDNENKIINAEDFLQLMNSMDAAEFNLALDFNNKNDNFILNIDEIAKSSILRATISKKIEINVGSINIDIAVYDDDLYRVVEKIDEENDMYYLSSDEFINFFHAIEFALGKNEEFSLSLGIDVVKDIAKSTNKDEILESSLMCSVLNKLLENELFKLAISNSGVVTTEVSLADIIYNDSFDDNQYTVENLNKILTKINEGVK